MDPREEQKRRAGEAAANLVTSQMLVGLGTGTTVRYFIEAIAERIRLGDIAGVSGVPTSRATAELALDRGIALVDLEGPLDLAVDGADEVAADLSLTKGGGGALLREKIVAAAADRFVVVVDAAKSVEVLGSTFRLPVEISRFGHITTVERLQRFGDAALRGGAQPTVTDNGNYIVDVDTGPIAEPGALDGELSILPGVLCTGLFVGLTDLVFVGVDDGVEQRTPA